jgi:hypothetical protein
MPNLQRVGLLTEAVKPRFQELGLLEYAALPSDADIDWASLEAPLPIATKTPAVSDIREIVPTRKTSAA